MMILAVILYVFLTILLLVVVGAKPRRTKTSRYELERRVGLGDQYAQKMIGRENLLVDIYSLQRALTALLLVILAVYGVAVFGWLLGILLAVFLALESGAIARWSLLQNQSQRLYEMIELRLLGWAARFPMIFGILRSVTPDMSRDYVVESREELTHLIDQASAILSVDEKQLMTHSLEFGSRLVSEIMTPHSAIDTIAKKEFLGPLVLDDLHKTGHSRFPVIDGDIDHIVGVLHIRDLLSLDIKRSVTVEKAMEPRVYYIRQDQPLDHALAAFIKTRHHLFIVINEFRETVGVVSLEDVIEALLGRKINDEFDTHEDLRAVAERNVRRNNLPKSRHDV